MRTVRGHIPWSQCSVVIVYNNRLHKIITVSNSLSGMYHLIRLVYMIKYHVMNIQSWKFSVSDFHHPESEERFFVSFCFILFCWYDPSVLNPTEEPWCVQLFRSSTAITCLQKWTQRISVTANSERLSYIRIAHHLSCHLSSSTWQNIMWHKIMIFTVFIDSF